jgi:hypothetical protein
MLDKIKLELDNYLEFDSNLLFSSSGSEKINVSRLVRVFGGAIRDIIADMPINDIDILSGSRSIKPLQSILESNGYVYMDSLTPKDLSSIYHDIKVINEPHTWIKGTKIVQIIRPVGKYFNDSYEKGFINLIQNVDMSCCGVSYDGENLYENYPNAILHSSSKVFEFNKMAMMYNEKRFIHRKYKLEDRGWRELQDKSDIRDLKINSILNDNIKYINETHNHNFVKFWL